MSNLFKAKDCDRLVHLRDDLTKLRCWLTGYHAGRGDNPSLLVPGEDGLRLMVIEIDDALKRAEG